MKKKYIAPLIKVRKIEADPMMAASTVTLKAGDGEPEMDGNGYSIGSKKGIFDSDASSSSIWDNE